VGSELVGPLREPFGISRVSIGIRRARRPGGRPTLKHPVDVDASASLRRQVHAFRQVAEDLDVVVEWFATERHGKVFVDRVYQEVTGDRAANITFLETRSRYFNDLASDLALELTRAVKLICDRVRECLWPDFRLSEGRTSIGIGMNRSLAYGVLIPQYPVNAPDHPYPGLRSFVVQRAERDYHFGDGPPPKGVGLPGEELVGEAPAAGAARPVSSATSSSATSSSATSGSATSSSATSSSATSGSATSSSATSSSATSGEGLVATATLGRGRGGLRVVSLPRPNW
jgi:hypothetical protein